MQHEETTGRNSRGALCSLFVTHVLGNIIHELQANHHQTVNCRVVVVLGNAVVNQQQVKFEDSLGANLQAAHAEIRLSFKGEPPTGRFYAQAIVNGFAEETGFSGFIVQGKITLGDNLPSVRLTGRAFTYDDHEWVKELRLKA
jgi:hypothetical protein